MAEKLLHNPHAGEMLKMEFLDELGLSQNALAKAIGVPANRINAVVRGIRRITADTDLRLCKYFSLREGTFLHLQDTYETMEAKRRIARQVAKIKPYRFDEDRPGV